MGTIDVLFFLIFFLFPIIFASEECQISMCDNKSIPIRFPFQLEGQNLQNCGYPGFDLTCNSQNLTVLKLPFSGEFFVRQISYITQEILLYDPFKCLPRRLLSFNLSGSPFVSAFYQNFTFLMCPSSLTKSRYTSIDCLSNSTHSALATSSMSLATSMSASCEVISTLQVPVSRPVRYDEGFSSALNNDLHLTWYEPDCSICEAQGGLCGFKSNISQDIGCFYFPGKDGSNDGLKLFRIICFSIAVPAITCAVGIACFACFVDRTNHLNARRSTTAVAAAPEGPEPAIVMMGLDETTIESYQKLVLGESRRLPGPNDITCPICLSEYCSKETLRCIPDCKHCFHAECIDEWLRLNGTCPVCRNNPSPSPARVSLDSV
ncbi:Putative RING-H2 finger protein ATL21A [Morus notabilis]|uniref:Putative RING-H2 finger protein ATL21A n=1 Tax=Morus notabilis TaxID=981085 RepID=W9R810_9ROSA|nr:putative RING-H2 finger protein ATL21A [Morus notabilis]EXB62190.1 Putative RING-H2 finger protein ATL21A [Morus notabilis]